MIRGRSIRVLLIEDNPPDTQALRDALDATGASDFELVARETLADGLAAAESAPPDVLVLDLHLPDSHGLDTLKRVLEAAPDLPVVVYTQIDDEDMGVTAVQHGAQDYLIKTRLRVDLVVRSLRYAIERHRMVETLRGLAMIDDLTGLYNRRGFMSLAEHHVKLAQRTRKHLLLIFADLDGFKAINDTHGHQEGDLALVETAEALRRTFRGSDIIARLGGDEFVVLALEPSSVGSESVKARLTENLELVNRRPGRPYRLSLSTGTLRFDPWSQVSIAELIARVDEAMYKAKRERQGSA
jgi:diguanylate cyclase (GGDEF)-like protein